MSTNILAFQSTLSSFVILHVDVISSQRKFRTTTTINQDDALLPYVHKDVIKNLQRSSMHKDI
jgi:hypothetical protein